MLCKTRMESNELIPFCAFDFCTFCSCSFFEIKALCLKQRAFILSGAKISAVC